MTSSAAGEPAIVVDGLVKRYAARSVLDGVSLQVRRGELVALLGPNGAGKTTTVEIVEGYRRGDGGSVTVLGTDPASGGPGHRARVGLMLQAGGLDPRARPLETIRQYGRFHADPRPADELLDLVGLRPVASTPVRRLSGGERQRLGLALALVGRPEVVVLDEPTAGMDPEARAATRAIVTDLVASGTAVLLTSHDLTDVERLADRIVILDRGRIVAEGTAAALAASVVASLRFRLDGPVGASDLDELGWVIAAVAPGARIIPVPTGDRYVVDRVAPTPQLVATVTAWAAGIGRLVVELRADGGTLEEIYLRLVAGDHEVGT